MTNDPHFRLNEDLLQQNIRASLMDALEIQRKSYLDDPVPELQARVKNLKELKRLVSENSDAIVDAICSDYGNRARHETLLGEIIPVLDGINDTIKRLKKWMKPQRRHVDHFMYPGAKNTVVPQPLGVVGIIVPWNFPVNLSFGQLTAVIAAGNRAMVKMSENSVALTRLLIKLSPRYLSDDYLQFFEETGEVGIQFSQLPFDLIIFTGSGATGRAVMASAAKNLTPVILELGGKAPAIVDSEYPVDKAVERIMFVKQFNAGQICTNVDYVFVHSDSKAAFVEAAKTYVKLHCPDPKSDDYTAIIDETAFKRLQGTLEDASEKGAEIINLCPGHPPDPVSRKFPLHLVMDTTPDMTIRQRETFGPLLMVLTYESRDEVVQYVNSHDRPLAIYPFSKNQSIVDDYIRRIMSGGVTVNDALFHVAQHDLPFGGVGPSGMGHYHGYEGFLACSKLRPVFQQAAYSPMKFFAPPHSENVKRLIGFLMRSKSR